MPNRYAKCLLFIAMLWLMIAGVGNAHSHICLDGQEPLVSLHFENFNGHPEHAAEEQHEDMENALMLQPLPGKMFDDGDSLPLLAVFFLFCIQPARRPNVVVHEDAGVVPVPLTLRPPLRAPPRPA